MSLKISRYTHSRPVIFTFFHLLVVHYHPLLQNSEKILRLQLPFLLQPVFLELFKYLSMVENRQSIAVVGQRFGFTMGAFGAKIRCYVLPFDLTKGKL